MTSQNLPAIIPNSVPAERPKKRNTRLGRGLSTKRVLLVEAMVFEGLSRQDAAKKVSMTDRAARYALNDRAVMVAYRQQLQILRESEKPKSVHRLAALRDQEKSLKVSLEASKFLAADEHSGPTINLGVNVNVQPGYVVDLSRHGEQARQILAENLR